MTSWVIECSLWCPAVRGVVPVWSLGTGHRERGPGGGTQLDADGQSRSINICSIVDEHTRECFGGMSA